MTAFPDVVPSFNILIPSTWFFSILCMWISLQNLFPYDLEIYCFKDLVKTKFHELSSCCRAKKMFAGELGSIFSHLSFLYVVITSLTLHILVVVKVVHSCPTLCDPVDYTVHGILRARILEWVAVPFSRGSSQPRDQTQVSCIAGRFSTSWATREAPNLL